jgi:hypothetical protein
MILKRLALLAVAAVSLAACSEDGGPFLAPQRSQAFVRWVNAVPDTFALNLRFVDKVEGSAWWEVQPFRYVGNYQGVDAGSRNIKVFGSGTNLANVSQVFTEATVTFAEDTYYTMISTGSARAGNVTLTVLTDPRPSPAAQIAYRVVNAGMGGPVDAYAVAAAGDPIGGTPTIAGVADLTASAYTNANTGAVAFRVTDAGTATIRASAAAPAGAAAASTSQSNQGGYSMAGSLLTAFVFPRSVAGSAAPQATAFQSPAVVWMQDNRP